jgi:hypothetical protein
MCAVTGCWWHTGNFDFLRFPLHLGHASRYCFDTAVVLVWCVCVCVCVCRVIVPHDYIQKSTRDYFKTNMSVMY